MIDYFQNTIEYLELLTMLVCIASCIYLPSKQKYRITFAVSIVAFINFSVIILKNLNYYDYVADFWQISLFSFQLIAWCLVIKDELTDKNKVRLINWVLIFYFVLVIIISLSSQFKWLNIYKINYFSLSNTIGVVILLCLGVAYCFQLSNSTQFVNILYNRVFYIVFALILYHIGTLPFNAMKITLSNNYPKIFELYGIIFLVLNYILNLTIIIVMLCKKVK